MPFTAGMHQNYSEAWARHDSAMSRRRAENEPRFTQEQRDNFYKQGDFHAQNRILETLATWTRKYEREQEYIVLSQARKFLTETWKGDPSLTDEELKILVPSLAIAYIFWGVVRVGKEERLYQSRLWNSANKLPDSVTKEVLQHSGLHENLEEWVSIPYLITEQIKGHLEVVGGNERVKEVLQGLLDNEKLVDDLAVTYLHSTEQQDAYLEIIEKRHLKAVSGDRRDMIGLVDPLV